MHLNEFLSLQQCEHLQSLAVTVSCADRFDAYKEAYTTFSRKISKLINYEKR